MAKQQGQPAKTDTTEVDGTEPTGFAPPPEAPPAAAAPVPEKPLRQGNAPICPVHQVPTTARSSPGVGGAYFTYYRCPETGCAFSQKVPRENLRARLAKQRAQADAVRRP